MPIKITEQQKAFVRSVVIDSLSQVDAYLEHFPKARKWKRSSAVNKAAALMRKPSVKAYHDEMVEAAQILLMEKRAQKEQKRMEREEKIQEAAALTLESHMEKLETIRDKALEDKNYSAAVKAEENRGKLMGFYVEKRENTNTNTTFVINADAVDDEEDPEEWANRMAPH